MDTTTPPPKEAREREKIPLSLLNDYLYCNRRAALKIIEGWRSANQHTNRGDIVHEHADLAGYEVVKGATLLRALPVWSDRLGLNGKCDVVEQRPDGSLFPVEFKLGKRLPAHERPIHLSSAMCPQHRLDLIQSIRQRLREGQPCRVVSTQLIEAGVDVDFPVVWRAMGPLDSIVQVAGRCNREGRLAAGEMHVFRPADHKLPGDVYRAAADQAAISLAGLGDTASESLATDSGLFGRYFDSLYQVVNTDYARNGETSIQEDRALLRFREVARKAKVIDDSGQPVIVASDTHGRKFAAPLIEEIRNRQLAPGQPRFTRDDLRRLQRFMVNVRSHKFQQLEAMKHLRPLLPNLELFVLNDGLYHPELGLLIDKLPLDTFLP